MNGTLARPARPEGAAADAERWGIPMPHMPEHAVWPANVEAVRAFERIGPLFRTPGAFGGACGLDYGGVRDGLELAGYTVTPALWAAIQCIEAGAVEAVMRKLQ